ncbi:beta-Ig-H3/fasciclin repeat containing protein [Ameyamaea chiangmaiensis NBRC 103196]|uniref:Fasciclin domain-containing protein n=1 Tax=Ameyamaea chiangmaiensis TaxID=442969 RepID=A0A850PDR2_9PROT|nr:fasciclin domain-containing protein [Ameyamaea chiangmaiensis]MBS4075275.1 fasciclin domain-containing protein [Ameyamaea chiangmaiensis]NVN40416.1 fasciclin domain-containing protein [Ameyamaea chiangmaiensis]GBQ66622.1 beta-Ig-H3/fasciclin repeat containing protein [Ameyamaea chiangmaiensis NBRC 103196]
MLTPRRVSLPAALALLAALTACESDAHQDSLGVQSRLHADILPTNSVAHAYHPRGGDAPDSPIAYTAPASPSFADRPLDENLRASIELADYVHGLDRTGLMTRLARSGPFTVFAIPNEALETYAGATPPAQLFAASRLPAMTRLLGYTIVRGRWTEARLRKAIARGRMGAIALPTASGDLLTIQTERGTGQLLLANARGATNRLWVRDLAQSNGVLYLTQSVLPPG